MVGTGISINNRPCFIPWKLSSTGNISGDERFLFCQALGLEIVNTVGSGSFISLGFFFFCFSSSSSSSFFRCFTKFCIDL